MKRILLVLAILLCIAAASTPQINHLQKKEQLILRQAEVSPGVWAKYYEYQMLWELEDGSITGVHTKQNETPRFWQKDSAWLSISWRDAEVAWLGVGVPICLRAWKDELYLIVFDRDTDFGHIRFRYYRQSHNVLSEISAKDFPREIATQNLWLKTNNGTRMDGSIVNEVEIAKALDPGAADFQRSLTAKIWFQCETGKEYYEIQGDVDRAFLEGYLKKFVVVRLTEIQPKADTQPAK